MAAVVLLAMTAVAASVLSFWNERTKNYKLVRHEYNKGLEAYENGDFPRRKSTIDARRRTRRALLAEHLGPPHEIEKLPRPRQPVDRQGEECSSRPRSLEEIKAHAWEKSKLAERHERTRIEADALFEAADSLRFRLLWAKGTS